MATLNTYPDSISVKTAIQTRILADLTAINAEVGALAAGNIAWSYGTKTSDYTIVASTDTYGTVVFNNNGASGTVNFNLPVGVINMRVSFLVMTAQLLKVTAAGSNTIRYRGSQTAAAGYVQSNVVGTYWTMEFNGTEWIVTVLQGQAYHASGVFDGSGGSDAFAFFMGG